MNRVERLRILLAVLPPPIRKAVVLTIGGTILLIGIAMIVLPGPAMLVIPLGLAILSLEFVWAGVLLKKAMKLAGNAAARVLKTKPATSPEAPGRGGAAGQAPEHQPR